MKTKALSLLAIALVSVGIASCVDNAYNLDNVDMTLHVGSEKNTFWLPSITCPDKMYVDSILKADGKTIKLVSKAGSDEKFFAVHTKGKDGMTVHLLSGSSYLLDIINDNWERIALRGESPFLQDESGNIRLDIMHPILFVTLENQTTAACEAGLTLTAIYDDESRNDSEVTELYMSVAAGNGAANPTKKYYYLCDEPRPEILATLPADVSQEYKNAEFRKFEGLSKLVYDAPDSLEVMLSKMQLSTPDPTYEGGDFSIYYEVYAPLVAGPQFQVVYSDNLSGWHEDMGEEANKLNFKELIAQLEIENKIPFAFKAKVIARDKKGKTLPGVKFVDANNNEEIVFPAMQTTTVDYRVVNNDPELLNKIDGIAFEAKIMYDATQPESSLKPTDYFKINKLRLGIKGGVDFDAN